MNIRKQNVTLPSCAVILLMAAVHQFDQNAYPRSVGAEHLSTGLQDQDGWYWTATHRTAYDGEDSVEVIVLEKILRDNHNFSALETVTYQFEMRDLRKLTIVSKLVDFEGDQLTINQNSKRNKLGRKKKLLEA